MGKRGIRAPEKRQRRYERGVASRELRTCHDEINRVKRDLAAKLSTSAEVRAKEDAERLSNGAGPAAAGTDG